MEHPRLFDGAFGTLYTHTYGEDVPPERAVLIYPERVTALHRAYREAGADCILSDTFGVNDSLGTREEQAALLRAAWGLAEAAGGETWGDIGPVSGETAEENLLFLVQNLWAAGARHILFETQAELEPLLPAMDWLRERGGIVGVSFAVTRDGYSRAGLHYRGLLRAAREGGASLIGLNCVCGPTHMLALLKGLPEGERALLLMPNAGYPARVNGRLEYNDSPEYFAGKLREMAEAGAVALGGCCGTTPAHIRETRRRLEEPLPPPPPPLPVRQEKTVPFPGSRHMLLAVEAVPPAGEERGALNRIAAAAREMDADWLTLPDSPLARPRASAMMTAARLHRETGLPVLCHMTCRDRNAIALRGDLLAGRAEGVSGVLAVTGDPLPPAQRERGGFSMNSCGLLTLIREAAPEMRTFAALNLNAPRFEAELRRAERKIAAGAMGFLTQPLLSEEGLANLRAAREALSLPLFAGIMPVVSYRSGLFMNNEVPGIAVPSGVLEALRGRSKQEAGHLALAYAREMMAAAAPYCDGYYLMTSLGRDDITKELGIWVRETGQ